MPRDSEPRVRHREKQHVTPRVRSKESRAGEDLQTAGSPEPVMRRGDPTKAPSDLPPEIDELCNQFLQDSFAFATRFAEVVGFTDDQLPEVRGMILARCSDTIAEARLVALESIKP